MVSPVGSAPVNFNPPGEVDEVRAPASMALGELSLDATHAVHGNLRVTRDATLVSGASPTINFSFKVDGAPAVSKGVTITEVEIDSFGEKAETLGYEDINFGHLRGKGIGPVVNMLFAKTAQELGLDYFTIGPVTPIPTVDESPMGRLCHAMGMEYWGNDGFKCEPGKMVEGARNAALNNGWQITSML